MRIVLLPVGGYLVVAAVALLLAVSFFFSFRAIRLAGRRRRLLTVLRGGVLMVLVFAMLRPSVVYTEVQKQSATVVLLLDTSQSMQVRDAVGDQTRWQALSTALDWAAPALADLAEDFNLAVYQFSDTVEAIPVDEGQFELPAEPTGTQTAIGATLAEIVRLHAGDRLAAVAMLTDGAQRATAPRDLAPQNAIRQLEAIAAPFYPLPLGQSRGSGERRDVAIENLQVPQTIFVKNELVVSGEIRADGLANQEIPLQLLFEQADGELEVVDSAAVTVQTDGQRIAFRLSCVPQLAGDFKVSVRAAARPGELVTTNNDFSTYVSVLKGGLRGLYLEGAIRAELTYLRRALDRSANIQVDVETWDARRSETRPSRLRQRIEEAQYDVFLLGDLDSSALSEDELAAIRTAVNDGAGLLMLGGFHSFGPGGYQRTALGDVLPIEMAALERQNFDDEIATDLHLEGPLRIVPTAAAARHFVTTLAAGAGNAAVWEKLPPLEGANRFRDLKPRAVVLATDESDRPLLVVRDFGLGRVMAFAGDSTWRWVLRGYAAEHRRFWRQAILWLAHKEALTEGQLELRMAQRRFRRGRPVTFSARALSSDGSVPTDTTMTAQIIAPDDSRIPVRLLPDGEWMAGQWLESQTAGDYTIEVTAEAGTESLGTARARFLIADEDLEFENPAADPAMLSSLATITGGSTVAPEELSELLASVHNSAEELSITKQTRSSLWDRWPTFLVIVGLLIAEWWIRKRSGLV